MLLSALLVKTCPFETSIFLRQTLSIHAKRTQSSSLRHLHFKPSAHATDAKSALKSMSFVSSFSFRRAMRFRTASTPVTMTPFKSFLNLNIA